MERPELLALVTTLLVCRPDHDGLDACLVEAWDICDAAAEFAQRKKAEGY